MCSPQFPFLHVVTYMTLGSHEKDRSFLLLSCLSLSVLIGKESVN